MAEYIERKVLEDVMAIMGANETQKDRRVWARAISLLHDVPTADVAPVIHGEWEPIINAYRKLEGWICNRCGTETKQKSNYCPTCGTHFQHYYDAYSYCPHCGAKMDLEEQNNA